jgi:hypothetical protein
MVLRPRDAECRAGGVGPELILLRQEPVATADSPGLMVRRRFVIDPIYGGCYDRSVPKDGKAVLKRSIERYVAAVRGDGSDGLR